MDLKRWIGPLVLVTVAASAGAYLLLVDRSTSSAPAAGRAAGVTPVVLATAQYDLFHTRLDAIGTVRANESVDISARVTAPVQGIEFSDGMSVEAGQVLVRLAADEELAEEREEAVLLAEQRRELERIRGLVADRNLPRQRLDEQESRVSEAEARLEAAQARVRDRVIRAPFDGVVGFRRVSLGAMVTPGTIITTLDDISTVKLDFSVPESFLTAVAPGQLIEARSVAHRDRSFQGEVTGVDVRIDPGTRAATVRAELPNPDGALRPGMLLTVRLMSDERRSLKLPEGVLLQRQSQHYVFVVDADGMVEQRGVTIGRRMPGYVEILDGLEEGERVVQEGTVRVRPGSKVEVRS